MNTSYNPIFRATRVAFAELTTPAARRWYWQQLQSTAALAHQGLTLVRRWLSASRKPVVVIEPVQVGDSTIEPAQGSAPAQAAVLETAEVPAGWAAIEGNDSIAATLSEQAIAVAQTPAPAAGLEPRPEPSVLAAIELGATLDYEVLGDWQESLTEADEPLVDVEIPFSDELESGPPFVQDEDTSFFEPDEEDSDSLLEDDLEKSSPLPSDLNARLEAYLHVNNISVEPDNACSPHYLPTPTAGYSSTGAEVGE